MAYGSYLGSSPAGTKWGSGRRTTSGEGEWKKGTLVRGAPVWEMTRCTVLMGAAAAVGGVSSVASQNRRPRVTLKMRQLTK